MNIYRKTNERLIIHKSSEDYCINNIFYSAQITSLFCWYFQVLSPYGDSWVGQVCTHHSQDHLFVLPNSQPGK